MPELFESAADTVRWKNTIICHPSVQFSVTYIRLIRQTMLHCQKTNCSLFRQGLSPVSSSLPRGDALLNFKLSDAAIFPEMQVAILDTISRRGSRIFGHGGPAEFWPQEGALSPKFAQNRGFPLKLPENCMILNKSLGARAPPPGSTDLYFFLFTLCVQLQDQTVIFLPKTPTWVQTKQECLVASCVLLHPQLGVEPVAREQMWIVMNTWNIHAEVLKKQRKKIGGSIGMKINEKRKEKQSWELPRNHVFLEGVGCPQTDRQPDLAVTTQVAPCKGPTKSRKFLHVPAVSNLSLTGPT